MLYLTGIDKSLENLVHLTKVDNSNQTLENIYDLKLALNTYLRRHQPAATLNHDVGPIRELKNTKEQQRCFDLFGENPRIKNSTPSKENFADTERQKSADCFLSVFQRFRQLDENIYDLYQAIWNYFICAPSNYAFGGSSPSALGVLWVNPSPNWTQQDYAELIVRESARQFLFYDELRHSHFNEFIPIHRPHDFSFKHELRVSDPIDFVIHNFFAAVEVLLFRERLAEWECRPHIHPASEDMVHQLNRTLLLLNSFHFNQLSPRIHELLDLTQPHLNRWNLQPSTSNRQPKLKWDFARSSSFVWDFTLPASAPGTLLEYGSRL